MGIAPGFRTNFRLLCPLVRKLAYGGESLPRKVSVQDLNKLLLSRTNHTGSDVRISSGEILNPKSHPRQAVQSAWWQWQPCFQVRWKHSEHINLLELRSIFQSVQYHVSHWQAVNARIFHITDSYVCMSIISKGRTGSKRLTRVIRQLNAYLLAHGLHLIIAHVGSADNPTDGASRAVAI